MESWRRETVPGKGWKLFSWLRAKPHCEDDDQDDACDVDAGANTVMPCWW